MSNSMGRNEVKTIIPLADGARWYVANSTQEPAAFIMAKVAEPINAICIAQFEQKTQGPMSWRDTDADAVNRLFSRVYDIRASHRDYLENNIEVANMLDILLLVGDCRDPAKLFSYAKKLEIEAKAMFARGGPTLIFAMSAEEFFPNVPADQAPLLIPDARLIFPLSEEENALYRGVLEDVFADMQEAYGNSLPENAPSQVIVGNMAAVAGDSMLWPETAAAEALFSSGFLLAPNLLKKEAEYLSSFLAYFGVSGLSPESIEALYAEPYIYHEFGHFLWEAPDARLVEFAVNANYSLRLLEKIQSEPNPMRKMARAVIYVYQHVLWGEEEGLGKLRSEYPQSDRLITHALVTSGMLYVDEKGILQINLQDSVIEKAKEQIKILAEESLSEENDLANIELDPTDRSVVAVLDMV